MWMLVAWFSVLSFGVWDEERLCKNDLRSTRRLFLKVKHIAMMLKSVPNRCSVLLASLSLMWITKDSGPTELNAVMYRLFIADEISMMKKPFGGIS
jgi:hypothetical protein